MLSDRADLDDGYGLPVDDALALSIPLVGFADEPDVGGIAGSAAAGDRTRRSPALLGAIQAIWSGPTRLLSAIRYLLVGTALRARRTRTAMMVVLALAVSAGCWLGLRNMLATQRVERLAEAVKVEAARVAIAPIPLPLPEKSVLVARQAMPRGHILKPPDLVWRRWPLAAIKSNYIEIGSRPIEAFLGFVVREPIAEGDPISDAKIISAGDRGFLAAVLGPGMRAVSVAVPLGSAESGLILPGDGVDVLLTLPVPETMQPNPRANAANRHAAETILNDIRVLAIDQGIERNEGKANLGKTVTLEVTPKQAEIVALAGMMGKLSLSLRSLAASVYDQATATLSYITDADITNLFPRPATPTERSLRAASLTVVRRTEVSISLPPGP
jgi:pilus assembly protein CpaB